MFYRLVVDFGKPYEERVRSDVELRKKLVDVGLAQAGEDGDVYVYDSKGKDVTGEIFKKLRINERVEELKSKL